MDRSQNETFRQQRLNIVNSLEPRGKVLDALLEDGVLTENDIEHISTATTRKDRCHVLLSILPTRGPVAYGSFKRALQIGQYEFLAEQLEAFEPSETQSDKIALKADVHCRDCEELFQKIQAENRLKCFSVHDIFKPCCCLLLDNVEPKDIVDQLFHDHVISSDDLDRIFSGVTRRDRCQLLLETILKVQGHSVDSIAKTLKIALTKKYSYIAEQIHGGLEDIQILTTARKSPANCQTVKKTLSNASEERSAPTCQIVQVKTDKGHTDPKLTGGDNSMTNVKRNYRGSQKDETSLKQTGCTVYDSETDVKYQEKRICDNSVGCSVGGGLKSNQTVVEHESSQTWLKQKNLDISDNSTNVDDFDTVDGGCLYNTFESDVTPVISSVAKVDKRENSENCNINGVHVSFQQCDVVPTDGKIESSDSGKELVLKQMTAVHSEKPRRRLTAAFNYLSTLINQGDYDKFQTVATKVQVRFPENYDLMCIVGYLQTSMDLFQTNFDSAKSHINSTMALVPKTSNPRYFTLELFTAKTRMYITQKKLEKLQRTLDEAMMILETDPVGCTGRAAGWLYINHARNQTAQLSCLNLSKPKALKTYEQLFQSAKTSFQRSMTNFKQDGGKDGPFGFGYALCRLVVLLLRCGDNGLTMDVLTPPAKDVQSAGQYIQHLEDSDIIISSILDMHFRLAKCDYQFRKGNYVRAHEHAQIAHQLATDLKLLEFTEHAYNRVKNLRSKLAECRAEDEMSEDDFNRILFEESSDGVQSE